MARRPRRPSELASSILALAVTLALTAPTTAQDAAPEPAHDSAPSAHEPAHAPAHDSAPSAHAPVVGDETSTPPDLASFDALYGEVRRGEGRYPFEEAVLDNGLRVITLEDDSAPIVAVELWFHVGSKDEDPTRTGFAHLFEHMMFRGTDRLGPTDHMDYVRRSGGTINAYTSFDQTVYWQVVPSHQLEMVLWLEAERMAALKIDEGGFATEVKVVEEERRLGLNAPYGSVPEKILRELFAEHPYRWMPIGTIDHLRAATVQQIQDFWDTFYVPNNATLVLVGDLDHAHARRLAARAFGWVPRCPEPPRVQLEEPPQTELRTLEIEEDNGPVPLAGVIWRGPELGHPDEPGMQLLAQILGGGESSRVYLDAVRREEVAMFAGAFALGLEDAGLVIIGGATKPGPFADTDGLLASVWEQVGAVQEDGVTDEELEKARNQALRAAVTESLTVQSKASALGSAAVLLGDAQLANERLAQVESLTSDDLRRIARTWLVKERATEVKIEPSLTGMLRGVMSAMGAAAGDDEAPPLEEQDEIEGGQRATAGGPKAEAERPAWLGDSPPLAPPTAFDVDIDGPSTVLENGLRVVAVENREVPFVSLALRMRVGAFSDDPDAPGAASMAAQMVTRGTFVRDAEALAEELERYGIALTANAGYDSATVGVSCVTAQAERAMRLLAEVVQVPRFDEDEFGTLRDQLLTGKSIEESSPDAMAERAFAEALWGRHPYGRPADGTSETMAELDLGRVADWWAQTVHPELSALYVAGDMAAEDAFELADRFMGTWESEAEAPELPLPGFSPPEGVRIVLVDRPGSVQSQIRAGHEGIVRGHPFDAPAAVLTQIFGGSFGSRLNESLRVEKGLTYGAGGGLSSRRFGGTFRVSTFTKTETTAETVRAVIDEVARMRAVPPTDEELRDAVAYLVGSFAGSLETPQAVANRLWTLALNELPADYWSSYLDAIASTDADDVATVAESLLDPERLLVVVVGDASAVRESLEEIAPVEVVGTER